MQPQEINVDDLIRMIGELYVQATTLRRMLADATKERQVPNGQAGRQEYPPGILSQQREGPRGESNPE